jgi:Ankyrin repeats (3 copies)
MISSHPLVVHGVVQNNAVAAGAVSAACIISSKATGSTRVAKPISPRCCSSGKVTDVPTPVQFLVSLYERTERGANLLKRNGLKKSFLKPSDRAIDAYDLGVVKAVQAGNVAALRTMLKSGVAFDASNRFGESIIHMASRRGDVNVVRFLVEEANVQVEVRDDFGRTPLHDACWTPKPNYDVMDVLLQAAPSHLLLSEDIRGHTPFHYSRKEHWSAWVKFLSQRSESIMRKLQTSTLPANQMSTGS